VLYADRINWVGMAETDLPFEAEVKTRYHQKPIPATACRMADGRMKVTFTQPVRAITPGQAVVLYQGDSVLCGGRILTSES